MAEAKDYNKKRLMYIQSEDFYFLTYNIFILLKELGCVNEKRFFRDYKKISFLIDFISDPSLVYLIEKERLTELDKKILAETYSSGLVRIKEMNKLIYSLAKRKVLNLSRRPSSHEVEISLNTNSIEKEFFSNELFKIEIDNINVIKQSVKRLSSLTIEGLESSLYKSRGVNTWQLF